MIEAMQDELRTMLPKVLEETGLSDESSLNATIGHKTNFVIDLKNEIINSPEHYVALWTEGFKKILDEGNDPSFAWLFKQIKKSSALKRYLDTFLRRSYLKHYDELYKKRPQINEAEVWIGENHADYGLLVSPRFSKGQWENDNSEIRHFPHRYFSIGHVLATGLVIPGEDDEVMFNSVEQYLKFFRHVLVRKTASPHQKVIAALYCDFESQSDSPESIPLLIPEFRYEGREARHKYRLDFCIIDSDTMDKVGFELSPWSSHGKLSTAGKTQKQINEEAKANFEKEMAKHKSFFKKHSIFALIHTDQDLEHPENIFADMRTYLEPRTPAKQLSFHLIEEFFK